MPNLRDIALPPQGSTGWYSHYSAMDQQLRNTGGHLLDTFDGATDDDKLTNALAYQSAQDGRPPILLGAREYDFAVPRTLYSGLRIIGVTPGPKNLEQGEALVPSRVDFLTGISSGTASWWNAPAGNTFDVYMSNFAMKGNGGSSVEQFIDTPAGANVYASEFHSLSSNFMRSMFGRKDRIFNMTQVIFSGHWNTNNLWDTHFHLGGSDNSLWMGGYLNIGTSGSGLQTGTFADNDYYFLLTNLSKTNIGYIYITAWNGWRGIKIAGSSIAGGLYFYGGVYEGNLSGNPAPGSIIRIEGTQNGAFYGCNFGYGMNNPDGAEGGIVHITGGQWDFYSPNYYRGTLAEATPFIFHSGGRVAVIGAHTGSGETWTGRPRYSTTATSAPAANATSYSFYCPDLSMQSV